MSQDHCEEPFLHELMQNACLCEQESVHYFKYKQSENILYEYADDIAPRHLTATLPLDYDTVAAADKFGNIFVTRLPPDVSSQASRHCLYPSCSPGRCLLPIRLQSILQGFIGQSIV